MMDDEKQLLGEYGRKRPYSVPEGYFENLASRVMERVGEKPAAVITPWKRVRRPLAIAASVCALVGVGLAFLHQSGEEAATQTGNVVAQATPSDSTARRAARANPERASQSYHQSRMAEAEQKVIALEQQLATATQTLTNANSTLTNANLTLASANQTVASDTQTVESGEGRLVAMATPSAASSPSPARDEAHMDVLDAAADHVMADAADLFAMLEDE